MLVALGSAKPSSLLAFNIYLDTAPTTESENNPPAAVEVLFEEAGPKTTERLHPHDMLFTFEPVRQLFHEAIGRWLMCVDGNRRTANVFVKTFYEPNAFEISGF
jgi:hypothetical protein